MTLEEAIKRYTSNSFYEKSDGNLQGYLEFNQLTEWLKELKQLREQTRWIPVSERLPKETKTKGHGLCHVLVTHKYAGITRTHQAVFDQGKFLKLETYKEDNTVIAWQPLPEPYKVESEVSK